MMGRQDRDQRQLFYEFSLDEMIPKDHLLRRINVFATAVLADLHEQLKTFYSDIGRPSVDPELMIRMLLVGYCYGIRHERRLCQEVGLHLAYRWFCKLDLNDKVPHHSTFSVNRLGRFRQSEILRHIFERVVATCMAAGLVRGEGFAVDASVMEANASRYHGKMPNELDWTDAQRQRRAVAEYLAGLEAEVQVQEGADSRDGGSGGQPTAAPDRKSPKVISPSDPSSAWTAKANKRVQFGYGLNYLIDVEHAIIVDVEATPARTYDEVASTRTMLDRTEQRLDLKPDWLTADTAYGTGKLLAWLLGRGITPHIPCGKDIHRLMACSPVANSPSTLSGTSMSAPMASSCEPLEQSMIAASGTTCHNLKSAALARSSNDVRAHRSRRSRATSMKMHATMPGH
jgi:transposase